MSLRYPLVELLNAAFYLYFFWQLGASFEFLALAILTSSLLVIFFIDLDHQIIPDSITLPGMVIGLGVSFLPEGIGIVNALIGLLAGGGSLYLIAILGDWLFKKESMGGGDIKMAAMLGAFLGWQKVAFVFIAASAIGLVVSVAVMCISSKMRQTRIIPFGPFLASAAVLAIIYGDRIIHWYLITVVGITPW
ncbi:MAG: prepilin peptidase [Candidatus Zixiibacteriota bacterium]|nr:MAG: prepilin peptidase [candidate division Zixibacteria bacterium]